MITPEQTSAWYAARGLAGEQPDDPDDGCCGFPHDAVTGHRHCGCDPDCGDDSDRDKIDDR